MLQEPWSHLVSHLIAAGPSLGSTTAVVPTASGSPPCRRVQMAVDIFCLSSQYTDLASLGPIAHYTCGQVRTIIFTCREITMYSY